MTTGDVRGVLVTGDQRSLVDAVGSALSEAGLATSVLPFAAVQTPRAVPAAHLGLILCDTDSAPKLRVASTIVSGILLPWVVVSSAPPSPAWDALRFAGARDVVGQGVSLTQLMTTLDGLLREVAGVAVSPLTARRD